MSAILGLDANFALEMFEEVAEMEATFQRRAATGTDPEDNPTYGAWTELTRTLPDASTSANTPCFFMPLTSDPGEQLTTFGDYQTERYTMLVPYAPDLTIDDRVTRVRHAASLEVFWPYGAAESPVRALAVKKIDHTYPVLTTILLEEVR